MDWDRILHQLADTLSSPLNSIEILPGGLEDWIGVDCVEKNQRPTSDFPFLYADGNLGIPKKVLYKLYLVAIALFASSKSVPELCRASTCIILLTNPAHQTALNARKRLIQNGNLDPQKELSFNEILLQGSSDCAKESILWHHRRWLFARIYKECLHLDTYNSTMKWKTSSDLCPIPCIPTGVILHEFSVVRRTCEAYPRNYHAWTHWHFITDVIGTALFLHHGAPDVYINLLMQELEALRNWVDHHVSDHSSVFRICCLARLLDDLKSDHTVSLSSDRELQSLAEHALSLVTSYPSHESLWIYLRDLAPLLPPAEREKLLGEIRSSETLCNNPLSRFIKHVQTYKDT